MKLKWALNELKKIQDEPLQLNGTIDLENSLKERDREVISAEPVKISGLIEYEDTYIYHVTLTILTRMQLPSTRSLKPVEVSIDFPFYEIYLGPYSSMAEKDFVENEIVEQLTEDILDLRKPIEDAILTHKPTQVFTEEEKKSDDLPSGKSWKVLTEDKYSETNFHSSDEEGDPRFAVLKNLFPDEGKNN